MKRSKHFSLVLLLVVLSLALQMVVATAALAQGTMPTGGKLRPHTEPVKAETTLMDASVISTQNAFQWNTNNIQDFVAATTDIGATVDGVLAQPMAANRILRIPRSLSSHVVTGLFRIQP